VPTWSGFLLSVNERIEFKQKRKSGFMITITTHEHQFELRLKFTTGWMKQAARFIGEFLSFRDMRAIEMQREKELREFGLHWVKMN
jgi:hypothetical protein